MPIQGVSSVQNYVKGYLDQEGLLPPLIAATAIVVYKVWDRIYAAVFVTVAVIGYRYLKMQYLILCHLDQKETLLAGASALSFALPFIDPRLTPFACLLGGAQACISLQHAWKLSTVIAERTLQLEAGKEQTATLQRLCDKMRASLENLEESMKSLGIETKLEAVLKNREELVVQVNGVEIKVDQQYGELATKVELLSKICQEVKLKKQKFAETISTIQSREKKLLELTAQIIALTAELEKLTKEASNFKTRMSKLLEDSGQDQAKLKLTLEEFNQWFPSVKGGKNGV